MAGAPTPPGPVCLAGSSQPHSREALAQGDKPGHDA